MTTENQQKRDKIAAKIRALLDKTVENGCTEAEAMAAAAAADRLMAEYDITYQDCEAEVRGEKFGFRRQPFNTSATSKSIHEAAKFCANSVARYSNCQVSFDQNDNLAFFGTLDDSRMAMSLLNLIRIAMDGEWGKYLKSKDRPRVNARSLRTSFMAGMAERINQRLKEMQAARETRAATGKNLVVIKSQIVTEKYAAYLRANGIRTKSRRMGGTVTNRNAYDAGQASGGRVDLGGGKIEAG